MHFGSTREHCAGGQDFSFATIVRRNRSRLTGGKWHWHCTHTTIYEVRKKAEPCSALD